MLLLVGLLIAISAWIATHTSWDYIEVPTPFKGEAARNPFYAVQRFAQQLGARALWDHVLETPRPDAVVVLSAWNWDVSTGRRERIEHWVESGGRLVVDSSLRRRTKSFEHWSEILPSRSKSPYEAGDSMSLRTGLCRRLHEYVEGTTMTPRSYLVCSMSKATSLTSSGKIIWTLHDGSDVQAIRVRKGRGSVTWINATPFGNSHLFDGDDAALFVAASQLRSGDEVHFLSEEKYDSLPVLAWRFGAPVVGLLMLLIVLALWRGSIRFGPLAAVPETARRSLAEQIRGTGYFAMRFGGGESLHSAVVRGLDEAASRRISGYRHLPQDERIALIARATGLEATAIAAAYQNASGAGRKDLRSAFALLETARRRILT